MRTTTATAHAVAAVTLTAVLIGCGGDDRTTDGAPPPSTTAAAATVPEATAAAATAERLLPRPTGAHAAGVRDVGPLGSSYVRVWYPAVPATGAPAEYFTPPTAQALGLGDALIRALAPWAELDATPSAPARSVVVLTSGWASPLSLSTTLAEQLASTGHVVIGLDPLPGTEDAATPPDEGAALRRMADIGAAIDLVGQPPLADLVVDADTSVVLVGGHSFGGATAFEAAHRDERIDGVFDLDGTLHRQAALELPPVPALTIAGAGEAAAQEPNARHGERYHLVELRGAAHDDLTDAPLIAPALGELASLLQLGAAGGEATRATVELVDRFVAAVVTERPPRSAEELTSGLTSGRSIVRPVA